MTSDLAPGDESNHRLNALPGSVDVDVAIVGGGPVGLTLASLLGRQGHRVAVVEEHTQTFDRPRAIHFDHEIMRVFARLGLAPQLLPNLVPIDRYQWFGADGQRIMQIETPSTSPSGWGTAYFFYQPDLDAVLRHNIEEQPNIAFYRGWKVDGLTQGAHAAELTARKTDVSDAAKGRVTIGAKYVVGADGANSFIRQSLGIGITDLGFSEEWLVADVRPFDPAKLAHLPKAAQFCDPRRPHSVIANGRDHRRWEFQVLPGEKPEDFTKERVWDLLRPWLTSTDAELVRHAVYRFRSQLADTMVDARVVLVGDAAHLMPPFMGQGMCAGVRDAANLSWKLDLVLKGHAGPALLDTVTTERTAHNRATIDLSVMVGGIICLNDPQAAAQRDAALRAGAAPTPPVLPGLSDGFVRLDRTDPLAGTLGRQGVVGSLDATGLLDEVVGQGFVVLVAESGSPEPPVDDDATRFLASIDAEICVLGDPNEGAWQDVEGTIGAWLKSAQRYGVVIRPDGYVYGSAQDAAELGDVITELRDRLMQ